MCFRCALYMNEEASHEGRLPKLAAINSSLEYDKKPFFAVITYFPSECCPSM